LSCLDADIDLLTEAERATATNNAATNKDHILPNLNVVDEGAISNETGEEDFAAIEYRIEKTRRQIRTGAINHRCWLQVQNYSTVEGTVANSYCC